MAATFMILLLFAFIVVLLGLCIAGGATVMGSILHHILGWMVTLVVFAATVVLGGLIADAIIGEPSWWTVLGCLLGALVWGMHHA